MSASQPFVGEIYLFGGNFAPVNWHFCDGSVLSIAENTVLFELIGTTYGGDGQSTFQLPDLRGRVPLHQGNAFVIGEISGVENVTLTLNQIAAHTHVAKGNSSGGDVVSPQGHFWSTDPGGNTAAYTDSPSASNNTMAAAAIAAAGGSEPHTNVQPSLCLNYIISLFGIFPSQT